MVWDTIRGLKFIIELNEKYDYFDIVPDLEKVCRKRFSICNGRYLTVIDVFETADRLKETEYYKESGQTHESDSRELNIVIPIALTDHETSSINMAIEFLGYRVVRSFWFDEARIY